MTSLRGRLYTAPSLLREYFYNNPSRSLDDSPATLPRTSALSHVPGRPLPRYLPCFMSLTPSLLCGRLTQGFIPSPPGPRLSRRTKAARKKRVVFPGFEPLNFCQLGPQSDHQLNHWWCAVAYGQNIQVKCIWRRKRVGWRMLYSRDGIGNDRRISKPRQPNVSHIQWE